MFHKKKPKRYRTYFSSISFFLSCFPLSLFCIIFIYCFLPFCSSGTKEAEPTCGRPLGLRFDRYGVNLIVADAHLGLLKVDTKTGTVSTLVSSKTGAHGVPFKFVNDLDIDRYGTIYFTDSTAKWDRCNHK